MFGGFNFMYNKEPLTKHGIDKLELMVRFLPVLEGEQIKEEFGKFKLWIRLKIGRHMTDKEHQNLLKGVLNFVQSDEGTNERMAAIKYIVDTEFLE